MSKRFTWLLGLVVLVAVGLLLACGTNYNASSNGLVLLGSQGSALIETFSFDLGTGHISGISNPPSSTGSATCVLPGIPSSLVLDPAGAYAYAILTATSTCPNSTTTGIAAFKVNGDGSTTIAGGVTTDPNPVSLAMDPAGKFLFVAEGLAASVNVYAIGSGASLTPVAGTYTFTLPQGFQSPNFVAVAPSPTVFPKLNAVCSSGLNPPTTEFLYVADQVNNVVWEFGVDPSSGALQDPPNLSPVPNFPAGSQPSGIAVDACDRFVYVSNLISNNVSAYTICNGNSTQSQNCKNGADGTLNAVAGSPFSNPGGATYPGQLLIDPFGNSLYVLNNSSMVTTFRISPISGALTSGTPATVATGAQPKSMAIRSDDSWLFVANYGSATMSQYAVTPSSGSLAPQPTVETDNLPWGVAVK